MSDRTASVVPANLAEVLAGVYAARSRSQLEAALCRLGVGPNLDSDKQPLVRCLRRYVLVMVGPEADAFWKRPSHIPSASLFPHACAVCAFCVEAALHGTCEHAYAAFQVLSEGHPGLPLEDAETEFPRRRTRLTTPPPGENSIAESRSERLGHSSLAETALCDAVLREPLRSLGQDHLAPRFAAEELTVEEIGTWPVSAFLSLPLTQKMPAARARRLHEACVDPEVRSACLSRSTPRSDRGSSSAAVALPPQHAASSESEGHRTSGKWVISSSECLRFLARDGDWPLCRRHARKPLARPVGAGDGVDGAAGMGVRICDSCFGKLPPPLQQALTAALEVAAG